MLHTLFLLNSQMHNCLQQQHIPYVFELMFTCLLFLSSPGIGYASFVIVSLLNIYYIVILAWGLYYLFQCFQPELPWAKCKQPWNTESCVEDTVRKNKTLWLAANVTNFTSPVTEFWE